jgi:hypothetical protein
MEGQAREVMGEGEEGRVVTSATKPIALTELVGRNGNETTMAQP